MAEDKLFDSPANIWVAQIDLSARLPDLLTKAKAMELAKSAFAAGYRHGHLGYLETTVDHSRDRIGLGEDNRRVNAYVFDPPHKLIEIHAEQGSGALTPEEARALGGWLTHRADEIEPRRQRNWLHRLLGLRQ
jgi:hypothetical protein